MTVAQQATLIPGIKVDTVLQHCLDSSIDTQLLEADRQKSAAHESGRLWPRDRLAAGRLWWPLQWQALKSLGCPPRAFDSYARRLFARGIQCEDWLVPQMITMVASLQAEVNRPPPCQEQVPVTYRQVGGYIDIQIAGTPWEIKSVKNSKYARIKADGEPQKGHLYQGCLYALAIGSPTFGVIYVAADDFRVLPFVVDTAFIQPEVDRIIDLFNGWYDRCHQASRLVPMVPKYYPGETWHNNPKYNSYPTWAGLDEVQRAVKLAGEIDSWT